MPQRSVVHDLPEHVAVDLRKTNKKSEREIKQRRSGSQTLSQHSSIEKPISNPVAALDELHGDELARLLVPHQLRDAEVARSDVPHRLVPVHGGRSGYRSGARGIRELDLLDLGAHG